MNVPDERDIRECHQIVVVGLVGEVIPENGCKPIELARLTIEVDRRLEGPGDAERRRSLQATRAAAADVASERAAVRPELVRFAEVGTTPSEEVLPVDFESYVDLLEATGAAVRSGSPEAVLPDSVARTLERLGIRSEHWLEAIRTYRKRFFTMIGCVRRIERHRERDTVLVAKVAIEGAYGDAGADRDVHGLRRQAPAYLIRLHRRQLPEARQRQLHLLGARVHFVRTKALTLVVRSTKVRPMPKRAPTRRPGPLRSAAAAPAPERILEAALQAFAERGFDGASTREIAAAAGVPQGLVNYHFESKQSLWEAAVDAVFAEFAREVAGVVEALRDVDPATRLRAAAKRFVRFAARHPEVHRLMTREGSQNGPRLRYLVDHLVRPLFDGSTALIEQAAPGLDAAHLHYVLLGAVSHLFAVAPEFEAVTGRDPRAPEMVEAHAAAVVDWLIGGALASSAAEAIAAKPVRSRR